MVKSVSESIIYLIGFTCLRSSKLFGSIGSIRKMLEKIVHQANNKNKSSFMDVLYFRMFVKIFVLKRENKKGEKIK
jgi:hypothetical protein